MSRKNLDTAMTKGQEELEGWLATLGSFPLYFFVVLPIVWESCNIVTFVLFGIFISIFVMYVLFWIFHILYSGCCRAYNLLTEPERERKRIYENIKQAPFHLMDGYIYMMGVIAAASGNCSEAKRAMAEQCIKNCISLNTKEELWALFQFGMESDDRYVEAAISFASGEIPIDPVAFLDQLVKMAFLDGTPNDDAVILIRKAANLWGVPPGAQRRGQNQNKSSTDSFSADKELQKSYRTLNSVPSDSREVIEQHRRALIQEYHPDKLAAKHCSPAEIRKAKDKIVEINLAYDRIAKARGWS